jgi:hypothetical protein
VKKLLLGLLLLALLLAGGLRLRYGGGADFPDVLPAGAPLLAEDALETVADLPTPPGNIAVSAGGRVFVTLHPEARPQLKVVELKDGGMTPWPSLAFQTGEGEPRFFRDVLSLRIDRQNRLWTLDNGGHGVHPGRLLAFDLDSGAVLHEYEFPRALAGIGSHLNDFQVSPDGLHLYIAEASFFAQTPALIVYDVAQRTARRVLEGHVSVAAEKFTPVVQGRRMAAFGLVDIRPGVDSIALDRNGDWLYYAAVTARRMYRVRSADLRNAELSAAELAGRVEDFAAKTMSDGLTTDLDGNVYLSDLEHDAIVLLKPDREMQTLVRSPRLRWPDGFSFGPDGWLYVTCSSLHQVIGQLPSSVAAHAPYQVLRLRPGGVGIPGH